MGLLFVNKKKQKNFLRLVSGAPQHRGQADESFCALFSKSAASFPLQ
jgi:hypothetical protein